MAVVGDRSSRDDSQTTGASAPRLTPSPTSAPLVGPSDPGSSSAASTMLSVAAARESTVERELSKAARLALLDAVPVGLLLIDEAGVVRFANVRIAEMIGAPRDEIYGQSVLDFVLADDLHFAADLLASGGDFVNEIMGPSRIRYVDAAGVSHWTQIWAHVAPPELGVDGYIVTLTNESVRDVLVTAVSSVAKENELDRTLAAVALSARAMPLVGTGVILAVESTASDESHMFRPVGEWPIDPSAVNAYGTPWRHALSEGADADVDDVLASDLAPSARDALIASGTRAMFVRLIREVGDEIVGVYVVFRRDHGPATINQDDHLGDAVRLASLAFAQARRRAELETAAHRDALTGVSNRAAFNQRLESDRRHADVLFIDLDRFKTVNDTYGHQIGDAVVAEAAKRIELSVRRADTVYRTGGDEFVVVCETTGDDSTQRIAMAERIIDQLRAPFDVDHQRVHIGATIGIAQAHDDGLNQTVRAADRALYEAKERGRAGWAHGA